MSRRTLVRIASLVAVIAATFPLAAEPSSEQARPIFLWRIEGEAPSWLYGTIHVPDPRVLELDGSVVEALDACDRFRTELPLDPETMLRLHARMMLPEETTLKELLPKKLYRRLDRLFGSKGLPLAMLSRMKVWAIAIQASTIDHLMDFASHVPLDVMLYNRAREAGKQVGGLETVDEQMALFDGMSVEEQVRMLERTLDLREQLHEAGRDMVEDMVAAYVAGDARALSGLVEEALDQDNEFDRQFAKRLLSDRNVRMAERIAGELSASPGEGHFFAVGAGHLWGEDGLIALLQQRGYEIARVNPAD